MSDIRLSSITTDPNSNLTIRNGSVTILSSQGSSILTNGGIVVRSTDNSVNLTSGSLTSLGGISLLKDARLGGSMILDSVSGTISVGGVSKNRFQVDSITNKTISFAPDGQTDTIIIRDSSVQIFTSASSDSSSSGGLVLSGGLSIRNTANSQSVSAGGAVTIAGGMAVAQNFYLGGFITSPSGTIGNIVSTNSSVGVLSVTDRLIATGNSNTMGSIFTTGGNVGIGVTSPTTLLSLSENSSTSNRQLSIINSDTTGGRSGLLIKKGTYNEFALEQDNTGRVIFENWANGGVLFSNKSSSNGYTFTGTTQNNVLLTISPTGSVEILSTVNSSGIGSGGSLTIGGGAAIGNILFVGTSVRSPAGTIGALVSTNISSGTLRATGVLVATNGTNTIGSIVTTGGNVGIGISNPSARLQVAGNGIFSSTTNATGLGTGGALTIGGGGSFGGDVYIGGNVSSDKVILGTSELYTSTNTLILDNNQISISSSTVSIYDGNVTSGIFPVSIGMYTLGNDTAVDREWLSIENSGSTGYSILAKATGTGLVRNLQLGNLLTINQTTGAILSGTLAVSGACTLGSSYITGSSTINGNLGVTSVNATGITVGTLTLLSSSTIVGNQTMDGDLILAGDATIGRTLIVDGNTTIRSTTEVTNLSDNGSALLVYGGVGIKKGLLVGGSTQFNRDISFVDTANASVMRIFDRTIPTTQRWSIDRSLVNNAFEIKNPTNVVFSIGSTGNVFMSSACSMGSTLAVNGATTLRNTLTLLGSSSLSGQCNILNTVESVDTSTGALLVSGGVGIRKNLSVGGDTIITGNLTVNGTTTSINSENSILKDNLIVLNSGPIGTKDSGFLIQRYQIANDTGTGDVVSDTATETYTLGIQSGVTSAQVILPSNASSVNGAYTGWWIKIGNGFSTGQVRRITGYTGATRLVQLESPFTNQNPSNGDSILLYNKPLIGLIYDESVDLFRFTGTINDTATASTGLIGIEAGTLKGTELDVNTAYIRSSIESANIGTGALIISGGVGINKSVNIGGDLTVNGVNITPNYGDLVKLQSFTGSHNVSNVAITGLVFDTVYTNAFDIYLFVKILATSNRYANYHIRGIWKGGTSFEVVSNYVGDDTGINFGITGSGQIVYSAPSYSGFTSLSMRFRAYTL
jgi:hypothetical protein